MIRRRYAEDLLEARFRVGKLGCANVEPRESEERARVVRLEFTHAAQQFGRAAILTGARIELDRGEQRAGVAWEARDRQCPRSLRRFDREVPLLQLRQFQQGVRAALRTEPHEPRLEI